MRKSGKNEPVKDKGSLGLAILFVGVVIVSCGPTHGSYLKGQAQPQAAALAQQNSARAGATLEPSPSPSPSVASDGISGDWVCAESENCQFSDLNVSMKDGTAELVSHLAIEGGVCEIHQTAKVSLQKQADGQHLSFTFQATSALSTDADLMPECNGAAQGIQATAEEGGNAITGVVIQEKNGPLVLTLGDARYTPVLPTSPVAD